MPRIEQRLLTLETWRQQVADPSIQSLSQRLAALEQTPTPPPSGPTQTVPYTYDDDTETSHNSPGSKLYRGYVYPDHGGGSMLSANHHIELDNLRNSDNVGFTNVLFNVGAYVTGNIPTSYKDNIMTPTFQAMRDRGFLGSIRMVYNGNGAPPMDDGPARAITHIGQVADVLNANKDVIAAYQYGWIGRWGEEHYISDQGGFSGDDWGNNWSDRLSVAQAMCDAWQDRDILPRYPRLARHFSTNVTGGHNNRFGIHNDALLADDGDYGTWHYTQEDSVYQDKIWVNNLVGKFVMGEQEFGNSDWNWRRNRFPELKSQHYASISFDYNPDSVAQMQANSHPDGKGSYWDHLTRHVGPRLTMVAGRYPTTGVPGQPYTFEIDFRNYGWATPLRDWTVKLKVGDAAFVTCTKNKSFRVLHTTDNGPVNTFSFTAAFPSRPSGNHPLSIELTPPEATLTHAEYKVRLMNDGTWDNTNKRNNLLFSVGVA